MKAFRTSEPGSRWLRTWVVPLAWLVLSGPTSAAEPQPSAGKLQSAAGTLLVRAEKSWPALPANSDVPAGVEVVALPGERAEIQARSGAVQLSLWANLPDFYDFPLLESAVVLHVEPGQDLACTLLRGRVLFTQLPAKRTAQVAVTFEKNRYEFILSEPGTQLAIEAFGRWPAGAALVRVPKPERSEDVPTQVFLAYTLKGVASLKLGMEQFLMPASSSFRWDNVVGRQGLPTRNAQMPPWVQAPAPKPETRALQAAAERLVQLSARNDGDKAIREALNTNDPELRRIAVFSLAAIGDLPGLVDALSDPRRPDVRAAAIPTLQHWLGEGPGQDAKLYDLLTKSRMYSSAQAEIVLTLLHGFREPDRDRPETYETLIEYLRHSKIAIRELALSYLNRWVPDGRDIAYDAGSPAQVKRGYDAWKKRIPDGKLPPRP